MTSTITQWHALVDEARQRRTVDAALSGLLSEEAVFRSPAVHTPQEGRDVTFAYLRAAMVVLGPTLTYHREWHAADSAVLEFTAEVRGKQVHGVDVITWDGDGLITDFTVLVRPLQGLQALIEAMGAELRR